MECPFILESNKMKKKIIIDCDPGIDDSLALLYALKHPEIEVVAITIVAGNVPLELGLENAFRVLERVNRLDIPIYAGASQPLERDFVSAQDTHGMDGLGETYLPRTSQVQVQNEDAAHFLADYFENPTSTSLIAIGPLTNVAQALVLNPGLGQNMERFVSMGGAYKSHGNCSPVAEYNYWCDPHAAQIVYANLGIEIEMVGLDVTRQIVLTPNHLEYLRQIAPELAAYVEQITRFYFDFHWKYEGIVGCVINDPLAIGHFLDGSLCQGFAAYVDVVTESIAMGQTVIDAYDFYHRDANARVLTEVDSRGFFVSFIASLTGLSPEKIREDLERLEGK